MAPIAETSSKRKITRQSSNMAINSACINASVTIWLRELVKYMSDPWSRRWLEAVRTRWGLRCSRFQFDTTLRSSTIVSNNRNTLYIINGTRHQVDVQGTPKTCLTAIFVLSTSDLHTHRTRAFDIFADSAQTEYCSTFLLSVCPCVRPSVCHRRDISHFSHI